jgi:hypothetical protein
MVGFQMGQGITSLANECGAWKVTRSLRLLKFSLTANGYADVKVCHICGSHGTLQMSRNYLALFSNGFIAMELIAPQAYQQEPLRRSPSSKPGAIYAYSIQ